MWKTALNIMMTIQPTHTMTIRSVTQQINSVLNQPHWRHSNQLEGIEPLVFTNQRPEF